MAFTANVSRDGGWLGGDAEKLQKTAKDMPLKDTVLDEEIYDALVEAMQRTGFWGADAWYANHAQNRKYTLEKSTENGDLSMPILFIHARFDSVCATTTTPGMCEPMRKHCKDLTEVSIDAGHWVAEEKPAEVSAVIARWLVERCKEQWPGFWGERTCKEDDLNGGVKFCCQVQRVVAPNLGNLYLLVDSKSDCEINTRNFPARHPFIITRLSSNKLVCP